MSYTNQVQGVVAPGAAASGENPVMVAGSDGTNVQTFGAFNTGTQYGMNTVGLDMALTGQSAQTAIVNNILTAVSGSAATDTIGFKSFAVQVVSTGTAGTYIFEGSNDNVNFQTIPVFNQALATGVQITGQITASVSQIIYVGACSFRYFRLRISGTITGGSIQAFTILRQAPFAPTFQIATQNVAANLAVSATIASGTVTTVTTVSTVTAVTTVSAVTAANLGIPNGVTDVASAAITTTTTTAAFTPTFGSTYQVNIPVTVVSGTTPTMDVTIQESPDAGTNWYGVYDFPRITATGSYVSPMLPLTGNRVRYVQTIAGTTPSFTRAVTRLQGNLTSAALYRQIIDRTITLTTLSSTTVSLFAQSTRNAQLVINIGTASVVPAVQLQGSDDGGASWYLIGSPLTAVASSTVSTTVTNIQAQFLRAIVTTAGTTVVAGYVLVRGF